MSLLLELCVDAGRTTWANSMGQHHSFSGGSSKGKLGGDVAVNLPHPLDDGCSVALAGVHPNGETPKLANKCLPVSSPWSTPRCATQYCSCCMGGAKLPSGSATCRIQGSAEASLEVCGIEMRLRHCW